MTQCQRRIYLIQFLLNEKSQYKGIKIPETDDGQRQMLRGLLNVRMPKPVSQEFTEIQNAYLQEEIRQKGITSIADLTQLQKGIYLWQGDITTLRCGAIVNAANSRLLGCFCPNHSCIDNAVHTYAGIQLREACAELMKKQGHEEETGKAKITPAFNLPCDYVIHTVGPIISGRLTKNDKCFLPYVTALVWKLRNKTISKALLSAVFQQENFIFRMKGRQKLPLKQ